MTIRPGRPADEPALRALQAHLREPSPSLLTHGLATGRVLVDRVPAEGGDARDADGVPVGYVLPVDGDGIHVAELVVHPEHRREGRATRLLSRVLARTQERVTLLVAADNDAARALYDDLGFRPVERRPRFYDDGTDAILLANDP
ncbi:GNAT family N-acetyltransferase [Halobaculum sp. CBA1158]|uniref:GNAT family N-acetyltransferase n=1 Tax=Halobaculum sp. CBA1158 TaxID=2904243 RepID=UPI001F245D68|nr:N-acetyltransferase [Halobaculum sp. CBA1158]UIO99463.1 GNAT family N-acetyltransferase [Halobaculum sp. CBA1158]